MAALKGAGGYHHFRAGMVGRRGCCAALSRLRGVLRAVPRSWRADCSSAAGEAATEEAAAAAGEAVAIARSMWRDAKKSLVFDAPDMGNRGLPASKDYTIALV